MKKTLIKLPSVVGESFINIEHIAFVHKLPGQMNVNMVGLETAVVLKDQAAKRFEELLHNYFAVGS